MHYNYLKSGGAIRLTLGGELVHFSGIFFLPLIALTNHR